MKPTLLSPKQLPIKRESQSGRPSLYQKAETTSIREALVNRLTMAIRASLSLPEVLSTATRELGRALAASRVQLCLYNSEGVSEPLEYEYLAPGVTSVKNGVVNCDDPIGCRLSHSGQATHHRRHRELRRRFNRVARLRARSRRQIRVSVRRSTIRCSSKENFAGHCASTKHDRKRLWTEDEVALVEALAERLAIGIAQAELFEMVARGKTEWETTFDAMSDGIFIFDRNGELKRVNRAGAAMEALHPKLLLGQEVLRHSAEPAKKTRPASSKKHSKQVAASRLKSLRTRLNRPLLVSIEPVLDENDKAAGRRLHCA